MVSSNFYYLTVFHYQMLLTLINCSLFAGVTVFTPRVHSSMLKSSKKVFFRLKRVSVTQKIKKGCGNTFNYPFYIVNTLVLILCTRFK